MLLEVQPLAAGVTFLSAKSEPGDYIGVGQPHFLTPTDGPFSAARLSDGSLTVTIGGAEYWQLVFAPPASTSLSPGVYEGATRWPFQSPTTPGLDVDAVSRGCNVLYGRFTVLEAGVAPDGSVTSFAADFEQHCEYASAALFGSIRYNSSFDVDPTVSVASASRYEGDGEPNWLTFVVSRTTRVSWATSATYATSDGTAKAGTDYAATSGTVVIPPGETSAIVGVQIYGNTVPEPNRSFTLTLSNPAGAVLGFAQATGTILDDDTGKTFLEFESDPGDYIGLGQSFTLTPLDTTIAPQRSGGGVTISTPGPDFWNLAFMPPLGAQLVPGVYEGTVEIPNPAQPGFFVWGEGRGCGSTGRFVVFEARYTPSGDVEALAIDYEQHCDGQPPALFGSVRFNSLVPTELRLSVAPAATFEGDGEPQFLTFNLSLTRRTAVDVTVDYGTGGGTAVPGTDYLPVSGTMVIPKGQTTAQVKVPVLGNTTPQPNRTVGFTLSNPVGATLGFGSTTGTIYDDDGLTTWIRLDSEEGDYVGGGAHENLRPPLDGTVTVTGGANGLEVAFSGFQWWDFHFAPPVGQILTVGAYEGATRWPFQAPTAPGLDLSGQGRGCNVLTGRFDVLQADYGPSGNIVALAIDAEQHCENMVPALWASVRINSSIPVHKRPATATLSIAFGASEIPLGGSTSLTFNVANPNPQDLLTGVTVTEVLPAGLVVSTPNGLTGACGSGIISAGPGGGSISLSGAKLDPAASCTFSVNVTGASAGFYNVRASVSSTEGGSGKDALTTLKVGLPPPFLYFVSDAGDPVGQGKTFTLTPADGSMTITGLPAFGVSIQFSSSTRPSSWSLNFAPPSAMALAPGVFEGATRFSFQSPVRPGLDVNGDGRGCNTSYGRFSVLDVQFGPAGDLQVLAIDYEQHCDGAAPALFGSVRYNSLLGTGPRLSVAPAAAYEGDGEPRNLVFRISLSARAAVPVSFDYATVDGTAIGGTDYATTSGSLTIPAGQTSAQVAVPIFGNTVPQPDRRMKLVLSSVTGAPLAFASADGTILDDDTGRTFLDVVSDPGDPIGQGGAFVLTPLDAAFSLSAYREGVTVYIRGDTPWTLDFAAPPGTPLAPGVYENATDQWLVGFTTPLLRFSGNLACGSSGGRFVVLEADVSDTGVVRKLAVDFEQHCNGAGPALFGSVRYNSMLPAVPRLSVAPAVSYEGNGEPKNLVFRVSLSRRSAGAVSFDYATADGTAKAGTDYIATAGSASLPAGQVATQFNVPILGNRIPQPDRTLTLSLTNVQNAPVGFSQAQGTILDDDGARTLFFFQSESGDVVGGGQTATITPLDGQFLAGALSTGGMSVQIRTANSWSLVFAPPQGGTLLPGIYEGATRQWYSPNLTPVLDVAGPGGSCYDVLGRFVVHEATFDGSGMVQALAIDFTQYCNGSTAALYGFLRYNSAVPIVPRAAAASVAILTPCRVFDTRTAGGPLQPGEERTFQTAGTCGIPPTATALIANVTVTNPQSAGFLTAWRADDVRPGTSVIGFAPHQTRANNALIGVSSYGTAAIKVYAGTTGTVDVVLDVSGYFR